MPETNINTDIKFPVQSKFDIKDVLVENNGKPFNQTLVKINDSVLRLGEFEGEFPFHKHDDEDELFYVLEGELYLDIEDTTIKLEPGQGYVVPGGALHRTRSPNKTRVLMVASAHENRRQDSKK